jgi:hypothetical protein
LNAIQGSQANGKSTFVTVLAWIFIILAGFSTLISLLQNIMMQTMFSGPQFTEAMTASNQSKNVPAFAKFMFNNFQLLFAAFLVISAATLISAIGLLKRKNWARLTFVGLMALGIAWNIFGFIMQVSMFYSFPDVPANAPADFQSQFRTMATAIFVFGGLMAVGLSVLFGWLIKRLLSMPIALEFAVAP